MTSQGAQMLSIEHWLQSAASLSTIARKLSTAGLALAIWLTAGPCASADPYPSRVVRLLVGYTAGGPADIPARFVAAHLGIALGMPVVVENKPGAGSMIAMLDMLAQPRDGYTLLLCTALDPVNAVLHRKAKFGIADIAPVALIARYDYAYAVRNDGPVKTVADLIAYGRANPGKLTYGVLGYGSPHMLAGRKIEKLTGVAMTAVSFKGSADALSEIAAGRIDLYMGPPISVLPLYQGRQLGIMAVTGEHRLASVPDVPTMTEAGVPLRVESWFGICAGAGTPERIISTLNEKLEPILATKEYHALIEASGSQPMSSGPAELKAMLERNVRDAEPTIREFALQID